MPLAPGGGGMKLSSYCDIRRTSRPSLATCTDNNNGRLRSNPQNGVDRKEYVGCVIKSSTFGEGSRASIWMDSSSAVYVLGARSSDGDPDPDEEESLVPVSVCCCCCEEEEGPPPLPA